MLRWERLPLARCLTTQHLSFLGGSHGPDFLCPQSESICVYSSHRFFQRHDSFTNPQAVTSYSPPPCVGWVAMASYWQGACFPRLSFPYRMSYNLLNWPPAATHLACFQSFASTNKAAVTPLVGGAFCCGGSGRQNSREVLGSKPCVLLTLVDFATLPLAEVIKGVPKLTQDLNFA